MCFTPYGLYSPWRGWGIFFSYDHRVYAALLGTCTGAYAGGVHWVHKHPQPKKTYAQKHPKEEEKFCPDMLAKKNAHSAQIQQN